jgi:myo-inositol-1(or 4)-monophosphatase
MVENYEVLEKAISFATKAHQGTTRKGTKTPYILHPLEAAAIVSSMTNDVEVMAAAVLHDVLEDTEITEDQLRFEFGNRIADFVCAESENKREDQPSADTWRLRKQETINDLYRETRIEIKMIALSDKLSNMRAINWDFQSIGDELWNRFNQKDKAQIRWYYQSVADAISELNIYPAWKELDSLIEKTFD